MVRFVRTLKTLIGVVFTPRSILPIHDLRPDHQFKTLFIPIIVVFLGMIYGGWAMEEIDFRINLKKSKQQKLVLLFFIH